MNTKNEFTYSVLATLLSAVDEVSEMFHDGDLDAVMIDHLKACAKAPEIRELMRELRKAALAADGTNP